jgi:hypothetical protein
MEQFSSVSCACSADLDKLEQRHRKATQHLRDLECEADRWYGRVFCR